MAGDPERCFRCNSPLLTEDELETSCCERCGEILYEQSQRQREWNIYHPPEDSE